MIHEIKIKKVNQGFIVTIGCQIFVSESKEKMFNAISEYFENPNEAEKKYIEKNVWNEHPTITDAIVGTPRVGDQWQGVSHNIPSAGWK